MINRWGIKALLGDAPYDIGLMSRMGAVENAYNAVKKLRSSRGADIHKLTDAEDELLAWFREEGWI